MKIMQKIAARQNDPAHEALPVLAFLGDSVTHGCFELITGEGRRIDPVFDSENGYPTVLAHLLGVLYPSVPVQIVNAGISGDSAAGGLARLDRDVLSRRPDLTVVCYGLNDVNLGEDSVGAFHDTLAGLFRRLKEAGSEVIFLTPNEMNTEVSGRLGDPFLREIAASTARLQNAGTLARYAEAGRAAAREQSIPVCDVAALWQRMRENGVRTTELLSNLINHPVRALHRLTAAMLLETMLGN